MSVLSFFPSYLGWHYSRALRDMLGLWSNFLWFVGNLFSVKTLLVTLVQPLKLMTEEKGSFISDPSQYAQNLLVNVIMRIVGCVTRLVLVLVALLAWIFLIVCGVAAFVLWLVLPFGLLMLLWKGIGFML